MLPLTPRLPAEWEEQDGVIVGWPHAGTDWHPILTEVLPAFVDIVRQISRFEAVIIPAPDPPAVRDVLIAGGVDSPRIQIYQVPTNDTWARDYGPITVYAGGSPRLLDFRFNGWGEKYPAAADNVISRRLQETGLFGSIPFHSEDMVLEGGSIDSDGAGTILATTSCLLHPNRNLGLDRTAIAARFAGLLGVQRILWLDNGHLEGDDTDSHIDTLARFADPDTILYTHCDDPRDPHFEPLAAMAAELAALRTATGVPYRLVSLPWPGCVTSNGRRLPATYANFLIINNAVLVPTYNRASDAGALTLFAAAFPRHRIIAVDCSAVIKQNGSLHCLTMQLPKGVLQWNH